ncbi:CidA/LrgA family protein [Pararobbsia silviterrae]|nr:CidA/LrgA family protein [Pararobbsia silviterrae]
MNAPATTDATQATQATRAPHVMRRPDLPADTSAAHGTTTRHLSRYVRIAAGVAALSGVWWIASWLVARCHLPVSAGVVGLILLLALLLTGRVPVDGIAAGARWMLAELLLFFVPAVVSIIEYGHLLRHDGLQLMIIIVAGTVAVMVVTGLVVESVTRIETRRRARRFAAARSQRIARMTQTATSKG